MIAGGLRKLQVIEYWVTGDVVVCEGLGLFVEMFEERTWKNLKGEMVPAGCHGR